MLIAVVEPDAPAVPRLSVFVAALSVTPPPRLIVMAFVEGEIDVVPVCDAPPRLNVPEVWLVPMAMLPVVVVILTAPDASNVVTLMPDCHDAAEPEPADVRI